MMRRILPSLSDLNQLEKDHECISDLLISNDCIILFRRLLIMQLMKHSLVIVRLLLQSFIKIEQLLSMIMEDEYLLIFIPKRENQHLRWFLRFCMLEVNLKSLRIRYLDDYTE